MCQKIEFFENLKNQVSKEALFSKFRFQILKVRIKNGSTSIFMTFGLSIDEINQKENENSDKNFDFSMILFFEKNTFLIAEIVRIIKKKNYSKIYKNVQFRTI